MRKICDKKEKIHKEGEKSSLEPGRASRVGGGGGFGGSRELAGEGGRAAAARAAQWGPRRVGRPGGERGARRSGEGCPMGSPAGRESWQGKAGAPERRGLPGVERRVSTSQAEAAPAVTEGQHKGSGGRARRGSARVKRRPRPPRVSTSQAEAAPAVPEGQHEGSGGCARRNGGSARLGRGPLLWAQKCPS